MQNARASCEFTHAIGLSSAPEGVRVQGTQEGGRELPDAQVIETWNDGSNRWMLAINTEMGFRPVATWIEAELELR